MNKVEAFIRPEKLDNVKDALANEGILGLSVIQVTGRGVQRGVRTGGRGTQSYMASMLHQSKIEIVVSDADTQKTCQGRSNLRTLGVAVQDKCPFKWPAEMSLGYAAMVSDEDVVGPAQGRRVGGPSASRYFLTVALWIPNSRSIARSDIPLRLAF